MVKLQDSWIHPFLYLVFQTCYSWDVPFCSFMSSLFHSLFLFDFFNLDFYCIFHMLLVLSLPLFRLGCKSTSLSTGFFVHRPKQYNMIFWGLNLISEFFVFSWLIFWVDEISKCGWCLPGDREDWLKSLHKITTASWWFHHSLHLHID